MKLDGYSDNLEAHVEDLGDRWNIYPENFARFVAEFVLPDEIPMAYPSFIKPDVLSKDPLVAIGTWQFIMTEYLSIDDAPYEFEYTGDPLPEMPVDDEGENVVY
jgi:hypothetical protein